MKRFNQIIIVIIVLGVLLYIFDKPIQDRLKPFLEQTSIVTSNVLTDFIAEVHPAPAPCSQPITYGLGSFDTRFGISKDYFLSALNDAESIWEKPFGKDLFTYQPAGTIKVNLIYDYRQQATSKLSSLGIAVKNDQASYDALTAKYASLKSQYTDAKNTYDTQRQAFEDKNASYQKQVDYWNARGGAPHDVYQELDTERLALQTELTAVQTAQAKVNAIVDEINAVVVVLNRMANTLNISAENYNTIGATLGESFEEGLYQTSASGQEIDIYEFTDRAALVRVLAHELGHALGLDHVDDPKAIMYKLNTSKNSVPTAADMNELKARCGIK